MKRTESRHVDPMFTIIVIPCYNEKARLRAESFKAFAEIFPSVQFVFVDDASNDGTLDLLDILSRERPEQFSILSFKNNQGKAETVRQGVLHAMTKKPAFVGYLDADLSTPLEAIPLFLDIFQNRPTSQMILGSRLKSLGRLVVRTPLRHYAGRVIATAISVITGLQVYDSQCGAKLFRVTRELNRVFDTAFISRWLFDVEIIIRFTKIYSTRTTEDVNRLFYELPLPEWKDVKGSKVSLWDAANVPVELFRIWIKYRSMKYIGE
ncbi:MAG: glycosyltransferase [Deltaproteobacteria bacterium]|nr:glycosyltransferase [Deltaproteobacteria bacterium]